MKLAENNQWHDSSGISQELFHLSSDCRRTYLQFPSNLQSVKSAILNLQSSVLCYVLQSSKSLFYILRLVWILVFLEFFGVLIKDYSSIFLMSNCRAAMQHILWKLFPPKKYPLGIQIMSVNWDYIINILMEIHFIHYDCRSLCLSSNCHLYCFLSLSFSLFLINLSSSLFLFHSIVQLMERWMTLKRYLFVWDNLFNTTVKNIEHINIVEDS